MDSDDEIPTRIIPPHWIDALTEQIDPDVKETRPLYVTPLKTGWCNETGGLVVAILGSPCRGGLVYLSGAEHVYTFHPSDPLLINQRSVKWVRVLEILHWMGLVDKSGDVLLEEEVRLEPEEE